MHQLLMPEKLGKYRIIEQIGRGGMGMIFKAHDPVLDRLVALKVIATDVEITEELSARFFREAKACAQLSHPNIVTVLAMGEENGQLFIVMELLDGEDLGQLISDGRPLPLVDKLSIMIQVSDGLHYAHQKGIVHRDIKPGNVFLLRNGRVKILDFGLAQMANADGLTRAGLIMGSLRYISPEQARGRVDHRSDIYSVGAVFYELLATRPPFTSDDALHLLAQLRTEEPQALDELDAAIPPALAAVVRQAMHKDPGQRFPNLAQMRSRLDDVLREVTSEPQARVAIWSQQTELGHVPDAYGRVWATFSDASSPYVRAEEMACQAHQSQLMDETLRRSDAALHSPAGFPAAIDSPVPIDTPTQIGRSPEVDDTFDRLAAVRGACPGRRQALRVLLLAALAATLTLVLGALLLRGPWAVAPGSDVRPHIKSAESASPASQSPSVFAEVSSPVPSNVDPHDAASSGQVDHAGNALAMSPPPRVLHLPSTPRQPQQKRNACAAATTCSESSGPVVVPKLVARSKAEVHSTAHRSRNTAPPETHARVQAPRRCSDLLERASLGEPLTEKEETILRQECQ